MFSISAMPIERRVIFLSTFESFSRFEQRLRQPDTFHGYNAKVVFDSNERAARANLARNSTHKISAKSNS